MANTKISELSELTSVANDDVLVIVDDSASETKKISFANLSSGISVGNATELQFTAKNITGSTIAAGKAVYVSGASGSDTTIALAANTSASTMPAFGITKDAIANNASGVVVLAGSLAGINTSSFSEGDELYVSTAGDLTDTKPTGTALIQKIAKVAKAAASGTVIVTGAGRTNDLPNLPDGSIWIGDSSGVPQGKTLTAGTNVTITEDATTVTIASTGGGSGTKLDGQNIEYEVSSTALSADGDFEGMVAKVGDAGNTLVQGDVYYWNGAQNDWVAADNSAEGTSKGIMGIALGTSGTADGVLLSGVYYYGTPPGTAAGDVLYLSTTGDMTQTVPTTTGDFLRVMGQRLDANRVMFMPSQDFVEIGTTALSDLSDVTVTSPAVGQVLIYDATNSIFENNTLTAGPNVKITEADGAITIGAGDGQELELKVRESAVSAAGEVEGTIVKFGTTTGMTAGDVYCWNGTNWVQVDADAEATTKGLLGVALGTTSDAAGLLTNGVAYLSHDPGTAGDVLYVSTTAGQVTGTQPSATGDFVRVVGYCLADNKVFFSPSQDFIEIG